MPLDDLDLDSDWQRLPAMGEHAATFFRDAKGSPDQVTEMTMVTTELLENAIKYGPEHGAKIHLRLWASEGEAGVEVSNRVGRREDLQRLLEILRWIRGFSNPRAAYMQLAKRVSAERADAIRNGLGLARIAYEGHAELNNKVDHEGTLTVSAVRGDWKSA